MASPAQILANRENAKASTGPATDPGKAASAANAIKHGLSSGFTVLPHEDAEEYSAMTDGYIAEFQPRGYHEQFLVRQMCHARWRLARAYRLENLYLEMTATDDSPDAAIIFQMMNKGVDVLAMLHRHASAAERSYYQAHKVLTSGRACTAQTVAAEKRASKAQAEKEFMAFLNAPFPDLPDRRPTQNAKKQNEPKFGSARRSKAG